MKKVLLIVLLIIIQQIFAQNENENQTQNENKKRAISYQSQIKNSEGQPIEDGKYKVVFNLYDSEKEEKPVWFETQQLEIKDGILNALIGSQKKLQAGDFKDQLWLTIEIDDEESERQFVTASSYSMMAARLDPNALIGGEKVSLIEQPDGRIRIDINGPPNNPLLYINSLVLNLEMIGAEYFTIQNKAGADVGAVLWNSGTTTYQGGTDFNDFVIVAKDGRDMVLKSDPNTTTGATGEVYVGTKAKTNDLIVTGSITSNKLQSEVDKNLTIEAAQSTSGIIPLSTTAGNINIGTLSNTNNLNVTGGLDVKGSSRISSDIEITGNITGGKDINLTGTLNATNVNSSGSDLTLKSDLSDGKIVIGTPDTPNHLNVTGNLSITGKLNTSFYTDRDFFTGGTNNWQFHTPDDGRQNMYIINRMHSSAGDWTKQTIFHENGDLTANGKIYGKGDIEITGDIIGKKDINLTGTLNATNVNSKINASLFKLANSMEEYDVLSFTDRDNRTVGSIMYNRTAPWYGGKAVEGVYDDFVIYAREGRDLILKCDAKDNVHGEVYVGSAGHTNNLRVTGKIFATEIEVKLDVFPDYVFKKDYNLLSLTEVENHINSHGTLPGMPTEKEIVENGLNINQMQIKLVEKIEELTLHMIRLEKENSDLRARIDSINK